MISNHNLGALMGAPVQVQGEDDTIGTVGQIFVDPETGTPNWVTVHTGLFGRRETFVPLNDATWDHEVLHVPFGKKTIKDAPRIDTDEALSPEHEAELYRYYGLGGEAAGDTHLVAEPPASDVAAPATPRPVRLRKYVVTSQEQSRSDAVAQERAGQDPATEQRPGRHAREE